MSKMTMRRAAEIAEEMWSEGNAIGVVQRGHTIGFVVGRCFVDGRKAEIMGRSMIDWESAFANAGVPGFE